MLKAATLFTGFDGAGVGIQEAGFELAWGIESDDRIASVARMNGHNVITANVLDIDPRQMERVEALHLSPPCTRASNANSSGTKNEDGLKEAMLDIHLANKSIQFIEIIQPKIVTIENVWGYRKFQSFKGGKNCEGILPALERLGYWIDVQHVNAADFGVPQTRKRLILRAIKDSYIPNLPMPIRWTGWYEAIEDLIPTLPESKFAPWQLARFPEGIKNLLLSVDTDQSLARHIPEKEPSPTVRANSSRNAPRAFLVNTNQSGDDGSGIVLRDASEPAHTTKPSDNGRARAFLAAGGNGTNNNCTRMDDEPSWTIGDTNRVGNIPRAWLSCGRVVKITPRALARFQSFPDSYHLSGNNSLDCNGIGNACPPFLFKKIYEQLKDL